MRDDLQRFRQMLFDDGVLTAPDAVLTPLPGGVSSEIYLVADGQRRFVVKRALAKLKVQQDWYADTSRNRFERAFIEYVSTFRPDATPLVWAHSFEHGYFCMEYLDGFANWKDELLRGQCDVGWSHGAAALLAEIHAHSWGDARAQRAFDTTDNFDQLRIDPYLRATASRHPDLKPAMLAEAERLKSVRECLVHGDFSPKNLLHNENRLVALDCEVAWFGDPSFDLSFFLNHLFLKSVYHAPRRLPFPALIQTALESYRAVNPRLEVEQRTTRLLPMLMLARIDGKSPVEYLNDAGKQSLVRGFARRAILHAETLDLETLADKWFRELHQVIA